MAESDCFFISRQQVQYMIHFAKEIISVATLNGAKSAALVLRNRSIPFQWLHIQSACIQFLQDIFHSRSTGQRPRTLLGRQ